MNNNQSPFDDGGQFSGGQFPEDGGQPNFPNRPFPGFSGGQSPSHGGQFSDGQFPGLPGGQSPGHGGQFPGGQFPGGGGQPGFPGGQPPGIGFPGQPGNQFPGQPSSGNQSVGPPNSPPPAFTPAEQQIQPFAVDPGAIRGCLFRFTYIWLARDQFWFFPTFVGRNSVAGFRWRRNRWVYFGIDLNRIQSFQCY